MTPCWREQTPPVDREAVKARFREMVQQREAHPQVKGKTA